MVCLGMRRECDVGLVSVFEIVFHCKCTSMDAGDGWVLDERTCGTLKCDLRMYEREFLMMGRTMRLFS